MNSDKGQDQGIRGRRFEALGWLVVLVAFFVRMGVVRHAVPAARIFHDTKLYFSASQNGFFSRGIWAGDRSPVPLLLFKSCHDDPELIRNVSLALSVLGWLSLAVAVARALRSPVLRLVGAFLVLWLASSREVAQWNDAMLSESLSFSSAAFFLASALSFSERPRRWFAPLVLSATVFALCRDSNAYLVLMLGLLILAWVVYRKLRARVLAPWHALAGLAFVALFGLSNVSTNIGGRWQYPLMNVMVWRVLPDPILREQFVELGMPTEGVRAGRPRRSYDNDKRLESWRNWLEQNGKHAYERYLLGHPRYFLGTPLRDSFTLLGESLDGYEPKGFASAWPWRFDWLWLRSLWWLRLASLPVLCGGLAFLLRRGRRAPSALAAIGAVLTVLLCPHALVVWHGDAMEVVRHGLPVAFQLQLAMSCLLLALGDAILELRSTGRGRERVQPIAGD